MLLWANGWVTEAAAVFDVPGATMTKAFEYADLVMPWLAGVDLWAVPPASLLLFVLAVTAVCSYLFHRKWLPVSRQNRAVSLSYYACAPLVWLIAAGLAALGYGALVAGLNASQWLGSHLVATLVVGLVAFALVAWWNTTWRLWRYATMASGLRTMLVAGMLPAILGLDRRADAGRAPMERRANSPDPRQPALRAAAEDWDCATPTNHAIDRRLPPEGGLIVIHRARGYHGFIRRVIHAVLTNGVNDGAFALGAHEVTQRTHSGRQRVQGNAWKVFRRQISQSSGVVAVVVAVECSRQTHGSHALLQPGAVLDGKSPIPIIGLDHSAHGSRQITGLHGSRICSQRRRQVRLRLQPPSPMLPSELGARY